MQRSIIGVVFALALVGCGEWQPERKVMATVIAITPRLSRWKPHEVVVTLRSNKGLTAAKSVQIARLACRMGDSTLVKVRGVTLVLDDGTCERGPPLPPGREG